MAVTFELRPTQKPFDSPQLFPIGSLAARVLNHYHEKLGRPSLAPGIYFRLMMIGFFEGLDSERSITWRVADSLTLRKFLRIGLNPFSEYIDHGIAPYPGRNCTAPQLCYGTVQNPLRTGRVKAYVGISRFLKECR